MKIIDYISGKEVVATPEEVNATQPLSKALVEDYGYPKECIATRPQWRVKCSPSDEKKSYPTDIAVFHSAKHNDNNLLMICECKSPERKSGRSQLEDYLRLSRAHIGVWYNGIDRLYLLKSEKAGKVVFSEIPNIPRYGEKVDEIGKYRRKDLRPTHNLKSIFSAMRHYLAANALKMTRDETFAKEMITIIFCKIYDERFTKSEDIVAFRAGVNEKPSSVAKRLRQIFEKVKAQFPDVIDASEKIELDDKMLAYAVGELQSYALIETERDALGEAFEIFIGPSLKGGQGQFFTPRNVVRLLASLAEIGGQDQIIDPACGSGGFLVEALRELWKAVEVRGVELDWPPEEISAEKQRVAINNLKGIDKDYFLSKVAKAYLAILGDGRGGVHCANSLEEPKFWNSLLQTTVGFGIFDVVLTNPPFGKKLKIVNQELLETYQLGRVWEFDDAAGNYLVTDTVRDKQSPQILFVERCLNFLKENGRLAIVLPESLLCNPSHKYILSMIEKYSRILAVISFPEELFQPFTHAKVCGVLIEKTNTTFENPHDVFMAIAKNCGHDSRGLATGVDDIPLILERYELFKQGLLSDFDSLGFSMSVSEIRNSIYLPKYYDPEIGSRLELLSGSHNLISISSLVEDGILSITTGHEVGKQSYGTGNVPFVRTSDIANWEIKIDPKHGLSEEIYANFKEKQDVRQEDILMVRDGTYLVGTCAMVRKGTKKIVFQSHILKIRVLNKSLVDPYLLLAALTSPIVKRQIYAKRFTQDIIDTLGTRLMEVIVPFPKDSEKVDEIIKLTKKCLKLKDDARSLANLASTEIVGMQTPNEQDAFRLLSDF